MHRVTPTGRSTLWPIVLKRHSRLDDFTDTLVITGAVFQHCHKQQYCHLFFSHLAPAAILLKILACITFMNLSFNGHIRIGKFLAI